MVNNGNGRDVETGRFIQGATPGPGRPRVRQRRQVDLRKLAAKTVNASRAKRIFDSLADRAEAGDTAAATLLFIYLSPSQNARNHP